MDNFSNTPILSVSEFSFSIKKVVEQNFSFVRIQGEVSRPSFPSSGHIYFNLKDDNFSLAAIIWKRNSINIDIKIEEGLEVICTGKVTTFGVQSKYQILVESIELAGEGALLKLLEERKKQFFLKGFFDEDLKKKIPYLPSTIAVITSETGSVIKDILHRLNERFPCHVYLWSVPVQGKRAPQEIKNAIEGLNSKKFHKLFNKPDLIIIARGGGSIEDLWCFNEEIIIKSVFESDIPIISAIGHETDTTLIDLVSDLRAPTPSAAAEKAVPVINDIWEKINDLDKRLKKTISNKIINLKKMIEINNTSFSQLEKLIVMKSQKYDIVTKDYNHLFENLILNKNYYLKSLTQRLTFPKKNLINQESNLFFLIKQMKTNIEVVIEKQKNKLFSYDRLLQSNSYEKILKRGFTIIFDDTKKIIKKKSDVKKNQKIKVLFSDGEHNGILK